jgi:hypothetical protein
MGVPCGRKDPGNPEVKTIVVSTLSPSNVRVDPAVSAAEAVTLTLGDLGTFVFVGGQQWLDLSDETAEFRAEVADLADRSRRFLLAMRAVDARLARELSGVGFELGLDPSSYLSGGGTVDPQRWVAYLRFFGRLTGQGALEGTELTLALEDRTGVKLGDEDLEQVRTVQDAIDKVKERQA